MRMWQSALLFSLTLGFGFGQCSSSDTVILGVYYPVTRLNGNTVRGYAETTLTGPFRYYWTPYITGTMFRNSANIGSIGELGPGSAGGTQSVAMTATLSTWGPGTYSLTSFHRAYNVVCLYWVPPYTNGWTGYSYSSPNLTIQRPTVTMDHPIWYLGGVGGVGTYQVTGVLTADPKGGPETPAWTVTAGAQKVTLGCATCTQTYITSRAPSGGCTYDVTIQANVGGFTSDTFYIFIDTPKRMVQTSRLDYPYGQGGIGYKSQFYYDVLGQCNGKLLNLPVNEKWEDWGKSNTASNWPIPVPEGSWPAFEFDTLYAAGTSGRWTSAPREPFIGNSCNPVVSMTPQVMWHSQVFRAGSTQGGMGVAVQRDQAQWYEDHGCHLSIESPTNP